MSKRTSTTSSRPDPQAPAGGWSRRTLLAALPLSLLAGCSSDPLSSENYGRMLLAGGFNPFASPPPITRKQAAAVSYASIGVAVGDGLQTMLVLATSTGQTSLWTSSAHVALETKAGRIIRTGGLKHNLAGTVFEGSDPLTTGLSTSLTRLPFGRSLDFADKNEFGILVASRFSAPVPEEIEILGASIKTVHVRETCTCRQLDWRFTNEYWADVDNGMIWRSRQIVHPDLDAIQIDMLRPPA